MIFVLDYDDSFTDNLVQRLGEIDGAFANEVGRNDQVSIPDVEALGPVRIGVS